MSWARMLKATIDEHSNPRPYERNVRMAFRARDIPVNAITVPSLMKSGAKRKFLKDTTIS